MTARWIAAIDQGTTSTRCLLFDRDGRVAGSAQEEHRQYFPRPGWVEHDPAEIWRRTRDVVTGALAAAGAVGRDIAAIGLTNQRETTVVWDRATGDAVHPAIVWQDVRTEELCRELGALGGGADRYRDRVGLPLAPYFAGPKITWILDHVPGARARAEAGRLAAGTIDSYLAWQLTGGRRGGVHVTDVSNASRTMLMDLQTGQWDEEICAEMRVPVAVLPQIRSSSEVLASASLPAVAGVPLAGMLGDQQAAMVGQACLAPGDAKNTYGTGNFLLLNTGNTPVASGAGLLTTVGYRFGTEPLVYAMEGSIAVTGSLIQWFRDNLGLISAAGEIEELAASVPDNGGAYIVPAFSGLFAPYWRPDARGAIVGLTRFVTKAHLARAALEAVAFQTRDVVEAMRADSGVHPDVLKADGGMTVNATLMQFQADILGVPVVLPRIAETTALGAAYAAGLAVGFFGSVADIREQWTESARFEPAMSDAERRRLTDTWSKAVTRTFDWA